MDAEREDHYNKKLLECRLWGESKNATLAFQQALYSLLKVWQSVIGRDTAPYSGCDGHTLNDNRTDIECFLLEKRHLSHIVEAG